MRAAKQQVWKSKFGFSFGGSQNSFHLLLKPTHIVQSGWFASDAS
jgi:hypothetical protein